MKHAIFLVAIGSVACGGGTQSDPAAAAHKSTSGVPALAMDECKLSTGYLGDENCILPPPPDKGFQVHYGPTDYDNPETAFVLAPGQEETTDFPVTSSNDTDVYFYYRQYRLRPSAHHIILTVPNGTGSIAGLGRRVGTANKSQDYPSGGIIPPEDKNVGIPLAAHTTITASFHAINSTDKPQLREAWINFWYRDPSEITEPATEWFKLGSIMYSIPPDSSQTLGPFTCNVQNEGRLLWLYGHRHANNVRFTVSRVRGSQEDVIYDADKWEEPLLLEYSSTVKNPTPDIPKGIEGGWNGMLPLAAGDQIKWSCDVVNKNSTALRFTEQTYLGEMCIVDAEAIGTDCAGF